MSAEDLRAALSAVPGVASVEVTGTEDAAPTIRLRLDGTRPAEDVQRDVDHVISLRGYRRKPARAPVSVAAEASEEPPPTGRRAGLGKGLEELIPIAFEEEPPAHLETNGKTRFVKLAIEESSGGVLVRAIGSTGAEEAAAVRGEGERALLDAVATAVAALHHVGTPRLLAVEEHPMSGSDVVTVLVELSDGTRVAGAAVAEGSRPFTVGSAVDQALSGVD